SAGPTSSALTASARRGCVSRRRSIGGIERIDAQHLHVWRDVLPAAAIDRTIRPAATTTESAECAPCGSRVQHRVLIEVNRNILAVVPVGDRALQIVEHAAQNRASREQIRWMLHGHATGKIELRHER